jgi:hypothetical protein
MYGRLLQLDTDSRIVSPLAVGKFISMAKEKENMVMTMFTYSNHLVDKSSNLDLIIQNT